MSGPGKTKFNMQRAKPAYARVVGAVPTGRNGRPSLPSRAAGEALLRMQAALHAGRAQFVETVSAMFRCQAIRSKVTAGKHDAYRRRCRPVGRNRCFGVQSGQLKAKKPRTQQLFRRRLRSLHVGISKHLRTRGSMRSPHDGRAHMQARIQHEFKRVRAVPTATEWFQSGDVQHIW